MMLLFRLHTMMKNEKYLRQINPISWGSFVLTRAFWKRVALKWKNGFATGPALGLNTFFKGMALRAAIQTTTGSFAWRLNLMRLFIFTHGSKLADRRGFREVAIHLVNPLQWMWLYLR